MRCRQVIDKISEYLDGELDPELVRELERHLEHCEDCRIVVDTTKHTVQIFCNSEPAPLPEETRTRLRDALFKHLGKIRSQPKA